MIASISMDESVPVTLINIVVTIVTGDFIVDRIYRMDSSIYLRDGMRTFPRQLFTDEMHCGELIEASGSL